MPKPRPMGQVIAERIRKYRLRKGWSVRQLADECQKLGVTQLTVGSLTNVERGLDGTAKRGGRAVTADELLVLAYVLDVAPTLLVLPAGDANEVEICPGVVTDTATAARWIAGAGHTAGLPEVPGVDLGRYEDAMQPLHLLFRIEDCHRMVESYRSLGRADDQTFIQQRHQLDEAAAKDADARLRVEALARVEGWPPPGAEITDAEYVAQCRRTVRDRYQYHLGAYADAMHRAAAAGVVLPPVPRQTYDDLVRLDQERRQELVAVPGLRSLTDRQRPSPSPYALPSGAQPEESGDGR